MSMALQTKRWITWERVLLCALLCLLALLANAQDHVQSDQDETERIAIEGNQAITSWLELMPDGRTLLVATTQDHPVYVMDTRDWKVLRTIDVDGYYAGPEVKASAKGTYLMLRQRFYIDWRANKDREVRHQVLDFTSGRELVTIEKAHDAAMAPDERTLYALEGDGISMRSLPDGASMGRIAVPDARAALALSADGRLIAVSHRPTAEQLELVPSMRADRKAVKPAMKFREMVSVYDVSTGTLVGTVPEIYDHVYDMEVTADGSRLLIYAIAHTRISGGSDVRPEGVVNMVELPSLVPLRTGFLSLMKEPQVEMNLQGDRIALGSVDNTFNGRKVYVYDTATGEFTLDLDMNTRWRVDLKEKEYHDGGVPYHFLADGRTLVVGSGTWLRLVKTP